MAEDLWAKYTGGLVHTGAAGTPDFGLSEKLWGSDNPNVGVSTSNSTFNIPDTTGRNFQYNTNLGGTKPVTTPTNTKTTTTTTTNKNQQQTTNNNGGGGGGEDPVARAKREQEEAAARQAEANRQAAMNKYKGMVNAANVAKDSAKGQYDWLIDTIGSNKKDLLEQVAFQEKEGIQGYEMQDKKTREMYDQSRQEILNTYRDLNVQQEKILRASGQGQSSRSMEASLRLNNLMGKDLSGVSKNEADSLALIGNALTSFKEKIRMTNTSIEREATNKLDKAALDYSGLVNSIDANLYMGEQERETAYAQAEADLAKAKAGIETWAAQQKLEAEKTLATMKGNLDDFIVSMTDANGLLNKDLNTKKDATNKVLQAAGYTPLKEETDIQDTKVGVYTKPAATEEELQALLKSGQITPQQYQQQLAALNQNTDLLSSVAMASPVSGSSATMRTGANNSFQPAGAAQRIMGQDPLLQAMFQA